MLKYFYKNPKQLFHKTFYETFLLLTKIEKTGKNPLKKGKHLENLFCVIIFKTKNFS